MAFWDPKIKLPNFSARAGFAWKSGKSSNPTQIGFKDKKVIDKKLSILEIDNKILKAKKDEIIYQNKMSWKVDN